MTREFNVVSFFGWFEQGAASFKTLWLVPTRYFSSEVDPYAIKTSWHNFPWITHIGSVTDVDYGDGILAWKDGFEFVKVHALIGWPPCTNLSIAGNQEGLWASTREEYAAIKKQYQDIKAGITVITDENREKCTEIVEFFEKTQSHLFWEFVRFFDQAKPEYVFVENVKSMPKEAKEIISRALGFEPVMIDAALVSGQRRQRLYWKARRNADGTYTSVDVPQPSDKGIRLRDVLEYIPFDAKNSKGEPVWKPLPTKYIQVVSSRIAWWNDRIDKLSAYQNDAKRGNNDGTLSTEKTHALTCSKLEGNNLLVAGVIPANGVNRYFDEDGNRTKSKEGSATREFQITPFEDPEKSGTLTTFEKDNLVIAKTVVIPEATAKGYVEVGDGDCVDMTHPNSKTRRGRLMTEKANALTTSNNLHHVRAVPETITEDRYEYQYYWRKLTVRECARLQGFPEWYQFPVSDSRAYKGIGNSWQRDVIDHIFTYLFHDLILEKFASLEQEAQDLEIEARGQGVEGVLGVH